VRERRQGTAEPDRRHHNGGDQHGRAELVDPAHGAGAGIGVGDPVPEDHVEHEQRAVAEGEGEPERLPGEA
jgi:hypothetical protein